MAHALPIDIRILGSFRKLGVAVGDLWDGISSSSSKAIGVLVLALALFGALVVRDFSNPLVGRKDIEQWLFQCHYFAAHTNFTPIPHIDFGTNDVFYPYGVSNVLRPWHFESAYFYSVCSSLAGPGPWLQWYYVGSVFLCGVMVYFLVRFEFGARWAMFTAIALSIGNYFAVGRYPLHYCYAITHWMTLSLLLDFILVRRLAWEAALPLRLLLLKALAQTCCFGQDLGYQCGFSLTSTLVFSGWCLAIAAWRCRFARARWAKFTADRWEDLRNDLLGHPWANAVLAIALFGAAFLFVSLVFDVFFETRQFADAACVDTTASPNGTWRRLWYLFVPVLPWFCPERTCEWFTGNLYLYRPGLFFSGGAVLGILFGLRQRRVVCVVIPIVIVLMITLTLDLTWMQWIQYLPWFKYVRDPARLHAALPVLLFALILLARQSWRTSLGQTLVAFGLTLFLIETGTAYWLFHRYGSRADTCVLPREFYEFAEVVARSPGEAVLDWPFVVKSGNGPGSKEFGGYMWHLAIQQTFPTFHRKKVVGSYLGRLYPEQMQPLLKAGWQWLFLPDHPHNFWVGGQHRNFTAEEWDFVEMFFRKNDFCGIILYADLLPPETIHGFHQRFGTPVAEAHAPFVGQLQFIRKRREWRNDVDLVAGRELAFLPAALDLRPGTVVSFADGQGEAYLKSSWSLAESTGRWSVNEEAEMAFSVAEAPQTPLRLEVELQAFERQPFSMSINGHLVRAEESPCDGMASYRLVVPPDYLCEANLLTFTTPRARSPLQQGTGLDQRRLGIHLKSLKVANREAATTLPSATQTR